MNIEGVKIYGICLERLNHQIKLAKSRIKNMPESEKKVILESYNTGNIDEIIDILELYDIEHKTYEAVKEKLDDLAYTVSVLVRETIEFGYDSDGNLCLYLNLK